MAITPARQSALEVVSRVRDKDAYAHETMSRILNKHKLGSRDAGYATRLAYGTIACRGTLDETLAEFLSDPKGLQPEVLDALAISTYELLFEDNETYAVVSQGVDLVRSVAPHAARLANAVLRRVGEKRATFPWGDPVRDASVHARKHGHPLWLARMWREELGFEVADAVMAANNMPAPLYVAHLPFGAPLEKVMAELESAGAQPSAYPIDGCIAIGSPATAVTSRMLTERVVAVCDACAQLTVALANPKPNQTIVEIGSGRGTKSLLLAGRARKLGGKANIIGIDIHEFKSKILSQEALRVGASEITAITADATDIRSVTLPSFGTADTVVIDAPCSGLGTLRRHPDRRWKANHSELRDMAKIGSALLNTAAQLVRPGGTIVYSTCTIANVENQLVINEFLESKAGLDFKLGAIEPTEVPAALGRFVKENGTFQSLPEPGGPDGHFIARLVRV